MGEVEWDFEAREESMGVGDMGKVALRDEGHRREGEVEEVHEG